MPSCWGIELHFFRGGEAQNVDAGFQNVLGQTDESNVSGLQLLVLLAEDPGLVVELVDAAGKLIDVGADQVGGGGLQSLLQGGAQLGDGEHQVLGEIICGLLDGQILPGTVAAEDALDPHDGVENIGADWFCWVWLDVMISKA